MEKDWAPGYRNACGAFWGMQDPNGSIGTDILDWARNVAISPLTFIRRSKIRHNVEKDEFGHAVNIGGGGAADTHALRRELNW